MRCIPYLLLLFAYVFHSLVRHIFHTWVLPLIIWTNVLPLIWGSYCKLPSSLPPPRVEPRSGPARFGPFPGMTWTMWMSRMSSERLYFVGRLHAPETFARKVGSTIWTTSQGSHGGPLGCPLLYHLIIIILYHHTILFYYHVFIVFYYYINRLLHYPISILLSAYIILLLG